MAQKGWSQSKLAAKSSCEKETDNEENLGSTHIYPGPEI